MSVFTSMKLGIKYLKNKESIEKLQSACFKFREDGETILCDISIKNNLAFPIPYHITYLSLFLVRDLYFYEGNNFLKNIDKSTEENHLMFEFLTFREIHGDDVEKPYAKYIEIINKYQESRFLNSIGNLSYDETIKMFLSLAFSPIVLTREEMSYFEDPLRNLILNFIVNTKHLVF